MQSPHFKAHPAARLIGAGGEVLALTAPFVPRIAAGDAGRALATVLCAGGRAFRVGGMGDVQAGAGAFETLTGGSTGVPRRVIRSQLSWIRSFEANAALFGIGQGARVAVVGDLSHSLALYAGLEGAHLGAEVHLIAPLRPDRQAQAIAARGVTHVYATPPQIYLMLQGGTVMPCLRHVLVGGARLDAPLAARLRQAAPNARIRVFYGAAETSFITLAEAGESDSVGHPYPQVEIAICDAGGAEVAQGTAGEVWVRSPYLFTGYADGAGGTARWHDGWLSVGEMGVMRADGLHILGRAGRMVTVAGVNVFPEEVESALRGIAGIEEAALIPRPDTARGSVLMAVLMGDRGAEDEARALMRHLLGPTAAPKQVAWRDDWPRLPSGKTDFAAL